MKHAFLFALVALTADAGRFDRFNSRCSQGRSNRGLACEDGAFFEFAPASGAGMGTACACAAVTGAKGEAMTFTRTGAATCSPLGLASSGITNASLVECSANLPRVESSGSVLGLRVEGARTNVLTRFIDYANATWADVATPTLTGAQVSPWTGTYANLAVQFDDNDGAAFEGRTQTVTVTAATQYVMSCFVKAGTLNTARLSLDGTTADFTGLSSTTWTLATVVDASSSGVAIAAQALNGSTAAATGTVIWGGCQVEAGAYATSMIPTVAAAVTRNAESAYFSRSIATTAGVCSAATHEVPSTTGYSAGSGLWAPLLSSLSGSAGSPYLWPYTAGAGTGLAIDGTGSSGAPSGWAPGTSSTSTFARYVAGHNGTAWTICKDAVCSSNGVASAWSSPTYPFIKFDVATVTPVVIWTRVQVDPTFSRCTP